MTTPARQFRSFGGRSFRINVLTLLRALTAYLAIAIFGIGSSHASANNDMDSWRFTGITVQRFDNTCGLAAVSTLLRSYLGDRTANEDSMLDTWARHDIALGRKMDALSGISPLDILKIVDARGYKGALKVDLSAKDLFRLPKPVIVLVRRPGTAVLHFVVLKPGSEQDHNVYQADSILGHVFQSKSDFIQSWANPDGTGMAIMVERKDRKALANSVLRLHPDHSMRKHDHLALEDALIRLEPPRQGQSGRWAIQTELGVSQSSEVLAYLEDGSVIEQKTRTTTSVWTLHYQATATRSYWVSIPVEDARSSARLINVPGHAGAIQLGEIASHREGGGISMGVTNSMLNQSSLTNPKLRYGLRLETPSSASNSYQIAGDVSADGSFGPMLVSGTLGYGRRFSVARHDDDDDDHNARHNIYSSIGISAPAGDALWLGVELATHAYRIARTTSSTSTMSLSATVRIAPSVTVRPSLSFGIGRLMQRAFKVEITWTP